MWAWSNVAKPAYPYPIKLKTHLSSYLLSASQKTFVDTERALGRSGPQISAVVGYAGGTQTGPDGKVCYYYSDPRTVYERLGHAEVG